jgi:hypothetical protein
MSLPFLTILAQIAIEDPNRFNNFLMLGYFAIWLIGLGYVVLLANRQRNVQQDLKLMRRLLEEHGDENQDVLPLSSGRPQPVKSNGD